MKFGPERFAWVILIALGVGIGAFYVPFQGYDDTYITYRHSYNLATGRGLVFNPGEVFLGTSTPGFAVLLAVLALPWPDAIPGIANVLSVLGVIASGLALWEFGRMHSAQMMGFLAAVFWLTCPLAWSGTGGEMAVQLAMVLWAFVLADKGRSVGSAALLGSAVVLRPDAALACLVLFPVIWWRAKRFPLRELCWFAAIALPPYLAIWAYYGSPVPGSMAAKSYQREIGYWRDFWVDAKLFLKLHAIPLSASRWSGPRTTADYSALQVAMLIGFGTILVARRHWLKPIAWGGLVMMIYTVANPPAYNWYLIPILWIYIVLIAGGVDGILFASKWLISKAVRDRQPAWTSTALTGGFVILLLPAMINQTVFAVSDSRLKKHVYVDMAHWLNTHVPKGNAILHNEIGFLGFLCPEMRIIDVLGLIHPNIAREMARGNQYVAFDRYQPQVVIHDRRMSTLYRDYRPGFALKYVRVASFDGYHEDQYYDICVRRDMAQKWGLPVVPSLVEKDPAYPPPSLD